MEREYENELDSICILLEEILSIEIKILERLGSKEMEKDGK